MANHGTVTHAGFPVPYTTIEEANNHLIQKPPEEHNAPIVTLPLQPIIKYPIHFKRPLRMYKGVWLPQFGLQGALSIQQCFESHPTDLILASFPKCGTTWIKAMTFAMLTRTSYPLDQHPLHTHKPHQCLPYTEKEIATGRCHIMEAVPSPRLLSSHLPYSLSDSIKDTDCQIVYVWWDPKDALVSMWCFLQKIVEGAELTCWDHSRSL